MHARRLFPLLLLTPILAQAALVPGDTVITGSSIGQIDLVVDGTQVHIETLCTASIPGSCVSYVSPADSVFVDPKIGSKTERPEFLYQDRSCGITGSGCYVSSVYFNDTLSWRVVGKNATWILRIDSLEFRTTFFVEGVSTTVDVVLSMKASWTPVPTAALRQRFAPTFDDRWRRVDPLGRLAGPDPVPGSIRSGLEIGGSSRVSIPGF